MMREWCSPAVLRAIESAELQSQDRPTVAAEHLLVGLIEDEDGRVAVLLRQHGAHHERIRQRLSGQLPSSEIVVDRALAEARSLSRERDGEGTTTSEYFLLALLRQAAGLEGLLAELGLDRGGLEQEILGEALPLLEMTESIRLADLPDRVAAGRVLDAGANRARESLRVLDDYCRFVLDDAFLTEEIKRLRHRLVELLQEIPADLLAGSRETLRDVGTAIAAPGEMERATTRDVARVNWKRLQEALRSLEEFGKLLGPRLGEGLEQLRYAAYTLERAFFLGDAARDKLADAKLCVLLTGSQCLAALDWTIAEAAAGGAAIFQLREKNLTERQLLARACEVRRWTRQAGALFIVNDRPDIARLAEADGVHLGQDDLPVHEARKIVGPEALIGVSTHDLDQLRQAVLDGASYIGVGPTFPSSTKSFSSLAGLEFVKQAFAETSLPAFAVGGINGETITAAIEAGATRVAVRAAIARVEEPRLAALALTEALRRRG